MLGSLKSFPKDIQYGIMYSNSVDQKKCSFCYVYYSQERRIMMVDKCKHIFCYACVPIFQSQECEICGKSFNDFTFAQDNIQQVLCGSVRGFKICFNVQNLLNSSNTHQVCLEATLTLYQLAKYLSKNTPISKVYQFVVGSKPFDMSQEYYQKKTLTYAGISNGTIVKCVKRLKGGL